jgi:NAD(P)H dehydrogenase (quinone)
VSSTRTPHPEVAVTGATGAVGGRVAQILASSDVPQRLLARSPEKLPSLDNAVPHEFRGYDDRAGVTAALDGVHTLFMVSAGESADRLDQHRAFVDAAVAAGVQHIVYTSL